MRKYLFLLQDLKFYLKKNTKLYICFFVLFFIGVLAGIVIALSGDSYLKILNKENKILYSLINGTLSGGAIFWKNFISLCMPLIVIFVLSFNFYLSVLGFLIVAYQGSILTLTIFALVSTYGVSGVLNSLFLILPINLLYVFIMIFFAVLCFNRSCDLKNNKSLIFKLKQNFIYGLVGVFFCVLLISFIGSIIIPIILKSAIFVFF